MTTDKIKIPNIKGGFALLDVEVGRKWLNKYFSKRRDAKPGEGIGSFPVNKPLKVTITGKIVDIWGGDDGISQEFEVRITNIKVKP